MDLIAAYVDTRSCSFSYKGFSSFVCWPWRLNFAFAWDFTGFPQLRACDFGSFYILYMVERETKSIPLGRMVGK